MSHVELSRDEKNTYIHRLLERDINKNTLQLAGLYLVSVGGFLLFLSIFLPMIILKGSGNPLYPYKSVSGMSYFILFPYLIGLFLAITMIAILLNWRVLFVVLVHGFCGLVLVLALVSVKFVHLSILEAEELYGFFFLLLLTSIWWFFTIHLLRPFIPENAGEWSVGRVTWIYGLCCTLFTVGIFLQSSTWKFKAGAGLFVSLVSSLFLFIGGLLLEFNYGKGRWSWKRHLKIALFSLVPSLILGVYTYQVIIPRKISSLAWEISHSEKDFSNAISFLGGWGYLAEPHLPIIIKKLDHPNELIRSSAVSAVGRIGKPIHLALPALRKALSDKSSYVQFSALLSLRRLGKVANSLKKELLIQLNDPESLHRKVAIEILIGLGYSKEKILKSVKQKYKIGAKKILD